MSWYFNNTKNNDKICTNIVFFSSIVYNQVVNNLMELIYGIIWVDYQKF